MYLVSEPYEQVFEFDTLEEAEQHIATNLQRWSVLRIPYPYEYALYEAKLMRASEASH